MHKIIVLFFISCVIAFNITAQAKQTSVQIPPIKKQPLPPPLSINQQEIAAKTPFPPAVPKGFLINDYQKTFSWTFKPESLTTLKTDQIFEKSYTFSNYGRQVRISTAYPAREIDYQYQEDNTVLPGVAMQVQFEDFKRVEYNDSSIMLKDTDGKTVYTLKYTGRIGDIQSIIEPKSQMVFKPTEKYLGEPTISIGGL